METLVLPSNTINMPRVLKNAKSMHEGKKHASLESIHDGKSKI